MPAVPDGDDSEAMANAPLGAIVFTVAAPGEPPKRFVKLPGDDPVVVGRDPKKCDILLESSGISAQHMELVVLAGDGAEPPRLVARDTSTNGTGVRLGLGSDAGSAPGGVCWRSLGGFAQERREAGSAGPPKLKRPEMGAWGSELDGSSHCTGVALVLHL